tara:strand:- start:3887 stop:4366 length:480 start_codon:yes stop_codon:yes gene_type:complete
MELATPIENLMEDKPVNKSYAEILENVEKETSNEYVPEINVKQEPPPVPKPAFQGPPMQHQFQFQQPIQVPSSFSVLKNIPSEPSQPKKKENSFDIIQGEVMYIAIVCTLVYSPGFQNFLSFNFKTIYSDKTSLITTIFNTFIIVILYILIKKVKIKLN